MTTHTYKTCRNKGHARIWIEGDRLTAAGWKNGDRFNKTITPDGILLTRADDGAHKIAGTADRPIIDLCGKYLTEFFGSATSYTATFSKSRIGIIKVE